MRRLAAALRGAQLYAPGHPLVTRSIGTLAETLAAVHETASSITIGIIGEELVVGDLPVPRAAENMGEMMRRLQLAGIERIVLDRGVVADELLQLVQTVARSERGTDATAELGRLTHVRVGQLQVERQVRADTRGLPAVQELYNSAVTVAETLWDSSAVEGKPDADAARGIVDSLAEATSQNRTTLLALSSMKDLRQLHVYAHGERLDPHDGAGARAGHRRAAPA